MLLSERFNEGVKSRHLLVCSRESCYIWLIAHAFLIDYGASNHMVASIELVSSLQSFDGPSIQMGNSSKVQAKRKGSIKLEHGKFKDMLYVPSLAANLLSVY